MKQILMLAAVGVSLALASCGNSGGSSTAKDAIAKAEAEVPAVDNSFVGDLPSLCLQYQAALKNAATTLDAQRKETNPQSEAEYKEAEKKFAELEAEMKQCEQEIKSVYMPKIAEKETALVGKEVPCEFDSEVFSAVKVTIESFPDTTGVNLVAKVTTVGKYTAPCTSWKYLAEDSTEIVTGTSYDLKDRTDSGFQVTLTTSLASLDKATKIKFIKP